MRSVSYSVKLLTCLLAVFLVVSPCAAGEENGQSKDRVKAKEPSSVTVYGRRENVDAQELERKPAKATGNGLKRAATKTWNGIVNFGGWLLNVDDDIPSEREQRSRTEQRK